MAVTWRTSKTGTMTSGASFTITEPTSAASGDFEFVWVATGGGGTVSTPTGWTQFGTAGGANMQAYLFYVTGNRGGSAPTLTFNCTVGSSFLEWHAGAVNLGGACTIDASASSTLGNRTNPDCPAATAVGSADEAIALGFNWSGATSTWGAPAGYTIRSVNSGSPDGVFASKTLSASGSENPAAFTGGSGSANTWEVTLLLALSGGSNTSIAVSQATPALTGQGVILAHRICLPDQA